MRLLFLARLPGLLDDWRRMVAERAPQVQIVAADEPVTPESIDAALVLAPPRGRLKQHPKLKIVFSLGAGVEHLASDPELPDVPVVKLMSTAKQGLMNEWLLYAVLRFHRGFDRFEQLQRFRQWEQQGPGPLPEDTRVTVLGLGDLGLAAALMLRDHGFRVSAWSRTQKSIDGVRCTHGDAGLAALLPDTDILICLLALTPETTGLLNASLFSRLPRGASVINVGRGKHLVTQDLLAALDSSHLRGAMLDVTDPEPLPPEHPLWSHPRVGITPHMSAYMPHHKALDSLLDNYQRAVEGRPLLHQVQGRRGY